MHIGFFSSIVTDGHPTSGYELANEAVVEGFRSLGHTVSVIGFQLPRQRSDTGVFPLSVTNLENAEAGTVQKLRWILKAHTAGLPVAAAKLTTFPEAHLTAIVEREGPFDAHVLNSWQMAAAFPSLLAKPYGYVSHNVEHLTALENRETAASALRRYLYGREARLLKQLEETLCQKSAWLWTLSASDLENMPGHSGGGSVLPLVTPLGDGRSGDASKSVDIGMIGTWTWQANTLGLQWFLSDVVPLLPEDMAISVAGSVPSDIKNAFPRVDFPGRVESSLEFLENARVVALVSRGGTGVQLKTIEAFQAGHACVATSSSLRGVETMPANCRHADGPKQFADALIELVAASRADTLQEVDGTQFAQQQHAALLASLNKGLTAIAF